MREAECCRNMRLRETVSIYMTTLLVIVVMLVLCFSPTAPKPSPFPYQVPLDPQGLATLSWNVSYSQQAVYFCLAVTELKFGMLFGMSERGDMRNADLAILWSDGHNSYFGDAWTDQQAQIHLDTQQDYQLIDAHQSKQGFYLTFKRLFNTCDKRDYVIDSGTVHLLYGFLERPTASVETIDLRSVPRGIQRVQLLKPDIHPPALPTDVKVLEVLAPNVTIPDQETTYWCHISHLPGNLPPHHIVMYEPVITKGNEAIVHHMEVFQCAALIDQIPAYNGPCDSKMKPAKLNNCRHVLAAWAMGAQAFYYPKDAGILIGGTNSSKYLRLEVHYHNPLKLSGRLDHSGIRLLYTPTLRKFNAGIMELGLVYTPIMAIPPAEPSFVLTGYCTAKCTEHTLPRSGIQIFASQLHTHLAGMKVKTVLVKDGVEVDIVNADEHFSTHFQEIRMLQREVTVLPGDVLITSCTYNTEGRSYATVGGLGINEEMCVNYLHYYPLTQLELCKSTMDLGYLQKYFAFINRADDGSICTCPQVPVTQQYHEVTWDPLSRRVLKALYDTAPISMHCTNSSGVRVPGNWDKQPIPRVTRELRGTPDRCGGASRPEPGAPTLVDFTAGKVPRQ
ncbi:LOW QUALITY PROTEIN: dopamine beta-hydroxylase [Leucoraja erinacea]|uniref:LOW QUALITY PROTEIN: dopamine beta-hydroxylase n=1 Tax=Leucoraja erinaceus TaxID=7782 RepID=UPI002458048E|nr:LOW QUALITY PROTEIN: dopamine beta-hydroxylase [Leucoraja erinacea]